MAEWMVTVGDCREVMAAMDAESVDAIVCDPPYGLGFMGKSWDKPGMDARTAAQRNSILPAGGAAAFAWEAHPFQQWCESWAVEALRVLKPGGHLLAFGGTRTFHRMTVAIEDAGFEVRDCLSWLYGSGFPKSLNVGKAIDKAAGAEREVVGTKMGLPGYSLAPNDKNYRNSYGTFGDSEGEVAVTAPATDEARRWEGWGTALKPAWEPIVMARKPLIGTVAGNVLAHGTGGLNIDGSRIGTDEDTARKPAMVRDTAAPFGQGVAMGGNGHPSGRWPANVLLDEGAAAALDEQTGESGGGSRKVGAAPRTNVGFKLSESSSDRSESVVNFGDRGGASRFFYVAKASRRDRNEGLDGMPEAIGADMGAKRGRCDECSRWADAGEGDNCSGCGVPFQRTSNAPKPAANHHPTVKPTALMRHLVRLVTPPGGLVLDPFTGSGSTGKAAVLEGFRFHGIEQDAEYAEIARARIAWAEQQADEEPDQPTLM